MFTNNKKKKTAQCLTLLLILKFTSKTAVELLGKSNILIKDVPQKKFPFLFWGKILYLELRFLLAILDVDTQGKSQ